MNIESGKEEHKIIIYGAGDYGKRLYHFLKGINCKIDFFCQTNSDEIKYYDNVKIISVEQLLAMSNNNIIQVLIAIKDIGVSRQIKGYLLDRVSTDIYVYECSDFISQNITDAVGEKKYQCNVCGKTVKKFKQGGFYSEIFEKYHIIGGGLRDNVICPFCGAIDRVRWQYRVLGKYMPGIFNDKCSVLHFAPEAEIRIRIQANSLCDYYAGDIVQGRSMHVVDVTNIQFRDDFFDYIIINHVLEHIENEKKAIFELKRVLKPKGKIMLSFPICTDIDTYENLNIKTSEERLDEYGQEDHVRLYGKDFKTRLESYGLNVSVFSPQNECNKQEIVKYGFIYDDIVMICNLL